MVKNRKCLSCSTSYSYCPNCAGADRFAPTWKAEFCSESCKDLWLTATKYNMHLLSKDEAKSIISSLELKPIDNYVECVKRDYATIMTEEKKSRKAKRIAPVIEMDPVIEEAVEAEQIIEQPLNTVTEESHEVVLEENE